MLHPKFTTAVLNAWAADQVHPHRGRTQSELPPENVVAKLLDACFLTTLRDEEGQPVKFAVSLLLHQDVAKMVGPSVHEPLRFDSAPEFSAASLAKIAPAFDPSLATIVVTWDASQETLRFWGVWLHAPSLNRFTSLPVGVQGSASFRPDLLTLISKGRAALSVARGDSLIGTLQAGYFKPSTPTPFTGQSLGQHVFKSVEADPLFSTGGMTYWHCVRDGLELLLSEASLRGHGGTIVLLPSSVTPAESCYSSKYKFAGSFNLRATFQRCIDTEQPTAFLIANRKVANETIQRIAQLASVDGALILSFAFDVLAFGATLTAPRTSTAALVAPDGFGQGGGANFEISRYGTRHRSAMDFTAAVSGSIAFVISQDGPIRAFRASDPEVVQVWPDCTTSMFV